MAVVSAPSNVIAARSTASISSRVSLRRSPVVSCKPESVSVEEKPLATPESPAPVEAAPEVAPSSAAVADVKDSIFKGGFAQERLNGRTAMLGFVSALIGELASQDSVTQQLWQRYIPEGGFREQIQPESGLLLLPLCVVLVLFASFAPRINGAKPDGLTQTPKPWGPFTPEAEMINGRAAMLGFVALVAVEAGKGSALF